MGSCIDKTVSITQTDHPVHSVPSDINECAEVTCDNGATCVDQIANFSCTCRPGYTGRFCQDGKAKNSYVNLLTLEHAPTASGWNAPSFSRGCVLITFQKRCFHSKKLPLCVSGFWHELSAAWNYHKLTFSLFWLSGAFQWAVLSYQTVNVDDLTFEKASS